MHGVRLTAAYDGTGLAGWQAQPGQRTAQEEIERAASTMAGHPVRVRGASRTDAGVHALGQVAAFDAARDIPARGWMLGMNRLLPPDIALRAANACPVGYNPRFDAVAKTYEYLVLCGETRDPLWRLRSWFVTRELDVSAMQAAARVLHGTHDYRAFRAVGDQRENTTRTIHEIRVAPRAYGIDALLAVEVRGSAFLQHMVRILAGTLVAVGRGTIKPGSVCELLGPAARRQDAGPTAPPNGLTLVSVTLGRLEANLPAADR